MKKRIASLLLACVMAVSLVLLGACGNTGGEGTTLRIGASPAPHAEILEQVKDKLAEQGITLEIVEFNDYVMPNTALADGDIDANYFQHQPYLDNFNAENGTSISSAGAIHFEPLGIYPGRSQQLDSVPDGAKIGIPSDASNGARALMLLEAQGLITLPEAAGFDVVKQDIIDNPYNIEIIELEAAQIPASLPDLDFGVINGNYAVSAGLADKVLGTESSDSLSAQTYANIIAVREGEENAAAIKALVEALQSEEIRDYINGKYEGVVVPVF